MSNPVLTTALCAVVAASVTSTLKADITGFGDFSAFSINQADAAAAPTIGGGQIHLTNHSTDESRSVFYRTPQGVSQFTASFTFQAAGAPTSEFGACFVIQTTGAGAVANPTASGIATRFGYSDLFGTFMRSVAISLEYGSVASGSSSTAAYNNGATGGGSSLTAPLNLFSGNPINVSLSYNGVLLQEMMVDSVTGATFTTGSPLNIPTLLGGTSLGYVGFTGSTNHNLVTDQYFSNFQFTSVPTPGASAALALCGLGVIGRRRGR